MEAAGVVRARVVRPDGTVYHPFHVGVQHSSSKETASPRTPSVSVSRPPSISDLPSPPARRAVRSRSRARATAPRVPASASAHRVSDHEAQRDRAPTTHAPRERADAATVTSLKPAGTGDRPSTRGYGTPEVPHTRTTPHISHSHAHRARRPRATHRLCRSLTRPTKPLTPRLDSPDRRADWRWMDGAGP